MEVLLSLCSIGFCSAVLYFYNVMWLQPQRICNKLRRQGIEGPPPSFPHGNLTEMERLVMQEKARETITHDYGPTVFPYFEKWRKRYGPVFSYSMRNVPFLHVSHPELVGDMSLCLSLDLGKSTYMKKTQEPLFGHSIIKSNGKAWSDQRKMIAPEFFLDKVKGMVDLMVESARPLIESWESKIQHEKGLSEIKVDEDLRNYSADVISRACFGSSYSEGKEIFSKLRALKIALSKRNLLVEIGGLRYLPTRRNREVWRLNKEVRSLILKLIKDGGGEGCASEKGLLQAILQTPGDSKNADDFVVDNCKTIYIAGHETVAVTAVWCLLMLSIHPEWQKRARDEVVEVCNGRPPTANSLQKMKTLTMVIQETLRLYPPTGLLARETLQDMDFGGIHIPKGVNISIPLATLHHDSSSWGTDVNEFKPERFAKGARSATQLPCMYAPFGIGRRTCLGQNFAMVELKIVLSLILSKFNFSLSPNYQHCPSMRLVVEPEFGVELLMERHDKDM
ncbi:cytochrome P450 714B3-like [Asparagus officinalis]|uniref:cytochrome P450 714B3-like n=1 Tax=Asparagus officinalis TaxID=4686 RepID=UPI00098E49C9|nr:cytochrome P450 714B3-like [Asparagus officinalis]